MVHATRLIEAGEDQAAENRGPVGEDPTESQLLKAFSDIIRDHYDQTHNFFKPGFARAPRWARGGAGLVVFPRRAVTPPKRSWRTWTS